MAYRWYGATLLSYHWNGAASVTSCACLLLVGQRSSVACCRRHSSLRQGVVWSVLCVWAVNCFWQGFNMGCGITIVKYLLFIFNFVFAVSSLLWSSITSIKNQYDHGNEANAQSCMLGKVLLAWLQSRNVKDCVAGCCHFVIVRTTGLLFCFGQCRWHGGELMYAKRIYVC